MKEVAKYSSLEDKVVIITGGASGIGKSIVEQFLHQGSKVAFLDKEEDLGNNLVAKFNNSKHTPLFKHCDLTKIDSLKKTINEIRNELGLISILVNNAANDERHSIESVTEDFWDDRMNVNLKHYFFAIQSICKDMEELGDGKIVNIGSFAWMLGQGNMPAYTTAKSAVMGLTRTIARDLGKFNIRVNCVVPGWIITERQKKLWLTPEVEKEQLERQCIKRMLVPDDIAKAVLFFASDQSSGCTAQNYVIDGGIVN
jgi:NAD(P)-dependent dehydrogenase (short-subunit alcohol dehydrogenase family)